MSPSMRGAEAGGRSMVTEAGGVSMISKAGGGFFLTNAGGGSVVAEGLAKVAEGAYTSDSFTDESGNVGEAGF